MHRTLVLEPTNTCYKLLTRIISMKKDFEYVIFHVLHHANSTNIYALLKRPCKRKVWMVMVCPHLGQHVGVGHDTIHRKSSIT